MRFAYGTLLTLTIASFLWVPFLWNMLPLVAADTLFGQFRANLAAEVGFERATYWADEASQILTSTRHTAVFWTVIPALALNVGWAVLTLVALRSTRPKDQVRMALSPTTPDATARSGP